MKYKGFDHDPFNPTFWLIMLVLVFLGLLDKILGYGV